MAACTGPGRSRRAIVVVLSLLLAAFALDAVDAGSSSSAALPPAQQAAALGNARPSVPLPAEPAGLTGVVGLANSTRVGRAAVSIELPGLYAVAYLNPTDRYPASGQLPMPRYFLPAHPVPGCRYVYSPVDADLYAADITQTARNTPAVVHSVGRFPDTTVSMLAFGSIPVTAVLHVRQMVSHGRLVPIESTTYGSAFSLDRSGNEGCDVAYDTLGAGPPALTVATGRLDASVSDVRVDGQPVDVGADCRTATPLNVSLFGEPPAYANVFTGGSLLQRRDDARITNGANSYPLYPGSRNLTIPPFEGCRDPGSGEDLSRLITSMVSGPDNSLLVRQSMAILNGISSADPTLCYGPGAGGPPYCASIPHAVEPPSPGR